MRHLPLALLATLTLVQPAFAQNADTESVIRTLGLSDTSIHPKRERHHGTTIDGRLPGGTRVEVELEGDGSVEEIEARDRQGFSPSAVVSLIPAAVRDNASYPADAMFHKVELDDRDHIEIEGRSADGRLFEAEFARDGRLIEMDYD
ncbi:hypothetical protein [Stappia sp.]|uniref:hypothetical protein n=1 Tax=Stappia sp. TaxID=1870903 RepID=UPI000C9767BC|nr:hypothetical protein [Stappia sp.]MAA97242.1 hypothetical protein [Stappia sp.]